MRLTLLLAVTVAGLAAAPLGAQDLPPGPPLDPGAAAPVPALPSVHEGTLPSGATLLVVPGDEVPLVTVSVVLPGGTSADPPGREGTARLLADLLTRGTESRSSEDIAARLGHLGADLSVSAGTDWMTATLTVLAPELPEALSLLADVVLRPALPADDLVRAGEAGAVHLEDLVERSDVAADRAFLRAVYGDHPYGRMESPETLRSVERDHLADFHAATFGPHGARVVVAGAVDPGAVSAQISHAFRGWEGPAAPPSSLLPIPRPPQATRLVVVHRPGAPGVSVRIGTALVAGDDPDWTVLELTERVLAESLDRSLFEALQEAGFPSGARTVLQRRREWGLFQVRAETTPGLALTTVDALLSGLGRASTNLPRPEVLGRARSFLARSFPLRMETAQQVAAGWLTLRLLGLDGTALAEEPGRVAALGPQDVRQAVEGHLDPRRMVVVVSGDATVLTGALAPLGEVAVVDSRGRPLGLQDLIPSDRSVHLDASVLEPLAREGLTLTYRMRVGERDVGRVVRGLEVLEDGLRYRSGAEVGDTRIEQAVTFTTPGFQALGSTAGRGPGEEGTRGGDMQAMDLRVDGGRLAGTLEGRPPVDMPLPAGTLLGDMLELAVVLAPLARGMEIRVPVARPETGTVENVPIRVEGRETVTVPAGTIDTWRVHIGGAAPQRVWATVAAPHHLVRLQAPGQALGQAVVLELVGTATATGGPR